MTVCKLKDYTSVDHIKSSKASKAVWNIDCLKNNYKLLSDTGRIRFGIHSMKGLN